MNLSVCRSGEEQQRAWLHFRQPVHVQAQGGGGVLQKASFKKCNFFVYVFKKFFQCFFFVLFLSIMLQSKSEELLSHRLFLFTFLCFTLKRIGKLEDLTFS